MEILKEFIITRGKDLALQEALKANLLEQNLDYFIIMGIMDNDATLSVNDVKYCVQPGNLVFIAPGKHIKIEEIERSKISIIGFTTSFFEKSATDTMLLHSELFFNCGFEAQVLPAIGSPVEFKKLIIDRLASYEQKDLELYNMVAHNCVEILLLDGFLFLDAKAPKYHQLKDLSALKLVDRFKILVYKYYKEETNVSYYADSLYVTARYLSEACVKILGKTAKEVITDVKLSEAIRIIKNTNQTISEISYDMGFSDESNFRRFLKTNTGKKPMEHRTENNL